MTTLSVEEYLASSFPEDHPAPELASGELEDREPATDEHAAIQAFLAFLVLEAAAKKGTDVFPRLSRHFRIAHPCACRMCWSI